MYDFRNVFRESGRSTNLEVARRKAGLSQKYLALNSGATPTIVSFVESWRMITALERMADDLGWRGDPLDLLRGYEDGR